MGTLDGGPYELWPRAGPRAHAWNWPTGACRTRCGPDLTPDVADLPISIGWTWRSGRWCAEAARVRLELAGGRTMETPAVGAAAGQGAAFYVVALPPDFGRVVAVVALGPNGQVLRRTPVE